MPASVSVIIAARNAEATIGRAVQSALREPETAEVVLVDDASDDATGKVAEAAAKGDTRLKIVRQDVNTGPAGARNRGIGASGAPIIALLDADDVFLEGRLAHLLSLPDWDMAADNIAFGPFDAGARADRVDRLGLAEFVRGNITRTGVARGELGFLKPLMRRAFLERHGLGYDPGLRLGEDYDLYVRCLMRGARFALSHRVGYRAEVRTDSLSARHGAGDLAALLGAVAAHPKGTTDMGARHAMAAHRRQIRARYLHRAFLDRKSERGVLAALAFALFPPGRIGPIAAGIARDKLGAFRGRPQRIAPTLLPVSEASGR